MKSNVTFKDNSFIVEKQNSSFKLIKETPNALKLEAASKVTPFFDGNINSIIATQKITLQHDQKLKAEQEVQKNGAKEYKNRGLYELYSSKTVAEAANSSPKRNKINAEVANEMEKEAQRVNSPD